MNREMSINFFDRASMSSQSFSKEIVGRALDTGEL